MKKLHIKSEQIADLKKRLNELVKQNKIIREGKYYKYNSVNGINGNTGEIDFGKDGRKILLFTDTDKTTKIFQISESKSFRLTVGDKVEFKIMNSDEGNIAQILKIIDNGKLTVSGKFENHKSYGTVIPDSREIKKDILISFNDFKNAKDGDKVFLEIINPEAIRDENSDVRGKIIEVLGKSGERSAEEKSIMRKFNLVKEFPAEIEKEADRITIDYDLKDRVDLRNKTIFTIDPVDAKDFDDAVSIETLEDGTYMLGVHIADVSHYVVENSELDKEALKRATSVYLVKNVIPMLPEKLSNDICSLKPN
ncbi:MAG: RNB domain-containing ribonuclease, partial [Ignavibacteria bacterium]|nr:RNB domain-containing ribonuclease [Ignavibacteria bacterium]